MTSETTNLLKLKTGSLLREMRSHCSWEPTVFGAALGMCSGVLAALLGSVLTAISWFTGAVWHGWHLQRDGTILFAITLPLLFLGAHCLDLIEHDNKRARARCLERHDRAFEEGEEQILER